MLSLESILRNFSTNRIININDLFCFRWRRIHNWNWDCSCTGFFCKENKLNSLVNVTDNYNIEEFSYLINFSDVVVTGDTVGLHIAISLDKKIVSFFGPTPHQEINLFGLGKKLVREELECLNCYDQFPCPYSGKCMSLISAEEVYNSIKELLWV